MAQPLYMTVDAEHARNKPWHSHRGSRHMHCFHFAKCRFGRNPAQTHANLWKVYAAKSVWLQLTLQSWKCSDWMVSWIRWFSCGPAWTDGAEEDASFKPSSTFLMLNFFILWTADHRIHISPQKTKRISHFISHACRRAHTHTHTQTGACALSRLSPPPFVL